MVLGAWLCLQTVWLHNYYTFDAIVLDRLLDPWPALRVGMLYEQTGC